jgi:signal peptidase I
MERVAKAVLSALGGLLVLAAVAFAVVVAVLPAVTGSRVLTVETGSMRPARPPGTVVVARPRPADQIAVGDVISFTDREPGVAPRTVTHRVIGIDPGPVFHTKGDANNSADPHTTVAADVQGVEWYHLLYVGRIRDRLVGPPGLLLLGGGLLLLVAWTLFTPPKPSPDAGDPPTQPLEPVTPRRRAGWD